MNAQPISLSRVEVFTMKPPLIRVSSRNFILGGKLTDHMAVRPQRGEGRLYYNILGGKLGQFGGGGGGGGGRRKLSCLGGKLPLHPPP